MPTTVLVQCILCPKTTVLARHDMSDAEAVKIAERRGWTIKPTVCSACNKLPKREREKRLRAWRAYARKNKPCPDCHGEGKVHVTPRSFGTCQTCHGAGSVSRKAVSA